MSKRASNEAKNKGPQFVRYLSPTLKALRDLGGSARPREVEAHVIAHLNLSAEQQSEVTSNGQSRFRNQVAWARFYLARAGMIDTSTRGVWTLTDDGKAVNLNDRSALDLFHRVHREMKTEDEPKQNINETDDTTENDLEEITDPVVSNYKSDLINALLALSPGGFERICQRLLRESGFQEVTVTGKSGDGGIDGHGVLQVNPFVTFRVLFQCKRYEGSVTPEQVRAFRGAMHGRTDKGIILTTGTFTQNAWVEASREGALPIQLVDRDGLLEMFEALELGLKPVKTYELDAAFFASFK